MRDGGGDSGGCVMDFPAAAASFANPTNRLEEEIFVETVIT